MAILPGTRLGYYEVAAQIGAGGMGEVYQAHDTKLGRDVAIKVLPQALEQDAERLARFQREAKMLAALNHPNIATIYGLEASGSTHYLVMELVPGETLADRVKREGPLPIEEALKIAAQIAEALEAAHEKSIIHRDLKPANVKITPDGKVKVLDFGLAKAFEGDATGADMSNSPTLTYAATMQGVILGTAAYMSPEQARGKSVDKRTDIWAFGAVLYELLTGHRAFTGEDTTEILASVVKTEPDWDLLPTSTPPAIRKLLRRCLQKDRTLRLRDAGDARMEIQEALAAPSSVDQSPAVPPKGINVFGKRELLLSLGTLLLVAAIASLATWILKPAPLRTALNVSRFTLTLPPGDHLAGLDQPSLVLSPDGTQLAFIANHGGTQQIFMRKLDSLDAKPVPDTVGATDPIFSPDGKWLGFFAQRKLMKLSLNGGAALPIASAPFDGGAAWSRQGTIAFSSSISSSILEVSENGGDARPMASLDKGEVSQRWPNFFPDGKTLFLMGGAPGAIFTNAKIGVLPAGTNKPMYLPQGGVSPRYTSTGHLVFSQGAILMAAPFDDQKLAVTGPAVPLTEGIMQSDTHGIAQYSISENGSLVYIPGGNQSDQFRLVWVNRKGMEQPLNEPVNAYLNPRISPDGRRLAVGLSGVESQIWQYDFSRQTLTRVTFEGTINSYPVWTPDSKRIAFLSNKEGPLNIYWQLADGSGGLELLTTGEILQTPSSWSPDGKLLAYNEIMPTGIDVSTLSIADRKEQSVLKAGFNQSAPRFSPDGRWLLYISDESGRYEVYVKAFPGPGGKYQISNEGGTEPVWNPNGREIFYRSGDKMMAVDIVTAPGFSAGKPQMLFAGPYVPTPVTFPNYDVSPDGQRFLMLKPAELEQSTPTQINVVLNWFEELKRKVPAGQK